VRRKETRKVKTSRKQNPPHCHRSPSVRGTTARLASLLPPRAQNYILTEWVVDTKNPNGKFYCTPNENILMTLQPILHVGQNRLPTEVVLLVLALAQDCNKKEVSEECVSVRRRKGRRTNGYADTVSREEGVSFAHGWAATGRGRTSS
jgi:hypothetical protein